VCLAWSMTRSPCAPLLASRSGVGQGESFIGFVECVLSAA
jgi:hypothetical protein